MLNDTSAFGDEPNFGQDPPLLFNVVYCSRAVDDITDNDVNRIIATCHRNNPRFGITGILVFGGGIFFQWLEGPRQSIERLMTQLHADHRHHQIHMISEVEESRDRLFPQWDMELVSAEHIRDVLEDAMNTADDPRDAKALADMLAEVDAQWGDAG
jgi:hypothetical protein